MEIPNKCPCCNGVLLNEYFKFFTEDRLNKSCTKSLDHSFSCYMDLDDDMNMIEINFKNGLFARWVLNKKSLIVFRDDDSRMTYLPFFEPDLNNYNFILPKIKKLMMLL